MSSVMNKPTVVVYHPEEGLQFLDRGGRWDLGDGDDPFWKRSDAILVDLVAQEVEG